MLTSDFVNLLDEELGLQIGVDDLSKSLDELSGWDSVYLLRLISVLERRYGRRIPLPEALAASDLGSILRLAGRT